MVVAGRADDRGAMTTLHIENTVRDYDDWKAVFDKFDRARRDRGVTGYRIRRGAEDPAQVMVDLEFDSTSRAEEFREFLRGVLATPQSAAHSLDHRPPLVLEVVEDTVLA